MRVFVGLMINGEDATERGYRERYELGTTQRFRFPMTKTGVPGLGFYDEDGKRLAIFTPHVLTGPTVVQGDWLEVELHMTESAVMHEGPGDTVALAEVIPLDEMFRMVERKHRAHWMRRGHWAATTVSAGAVMFGTFVVGQLPPFSPLWWLNLILVGINFMWFWTFTGWLIKGPPTGLWGA